MSRLRQLAEFVHQARPADLPAAQQARLKAGITDTIVALLAGAKSIEGRALTAHGAGENDAGRAGTATAIIRSTEVDDIHLASCTTPSSVAVACALFSGRDDNDPHTMMAASQVGIELIVRLGLVINGPSVLYRGIWPTYFAAPLGAAAATARVLGLDVDRTVHALSLALMASAGRIGRFEGAPSGRWALIKTAVSVGIGAAHAAASGFKGDPNLLDGDWLETAHGLKADMAALTDGLGQTSVMGGLSMKPFSTARQALAATSALQHLIAGGLDPASIKGIRVRVPTAYVRMISQPLNPALRASGYVSAPFQMALAALRRDALWDLDRTAVMADNEVHAFAGKVTVEAAPELDAGYPKQWPALITVETSNGLVTYDEMRAPGDADRPLSTADLAGKHRRLLSFGFGPAAAETTAKVTAGLESQAGLQAVRDLARAALNDHDKSQQKRRRTTEGRMP